MSYVHLSVQLLQKLHLDFHEFFCSFFTRGINYPNLSNIYVDNNLYLNTPGDLVYKNLLIKNSNLENEKNILTLIDLFLDKYSETKNIQILNYASFYIETFYLNLLNNEDKLLNISINNYNKILNQINLIKKFNLSEKNSFILIRDLLQNEAR